MRLEIIRVQEVHAAGLTREPELGVKIVSEVFHKVTGLMLVNLPRAFPHTVVPELIEGFQGITSGEDSFTAQTLHFSWLVRMMGGEVAVELSK